MSDEICGMRCEAGTCSYRKGHAGYCGRPFQRLADAFKRNAIRLPSDQAKGLAIMEVGERVHHQLERKLREREALEHSLATNIRRLEREWPGREPHSHPTWPTRTWFRARRTDEAEIRGLVATIRIIKRRLAELYFAPDDDQVDALTYSWETLYRARTRRGRQTVDFVKYAPPPITEGWPWIRCAPVEHTEVAPEGIKATTEAYLAEVCGKPFQGVVPNLFREDGTFPCARALNHDGPCGHRIGARKGWEVDV